MACKICNRVTSSPSDHERDCPYFAPSTSEKWKDIADKYEKTSKTFDRMSDGPMGRLAEWLGI